MKLDSTALGTLGVELVKGLCSRELLAVRGF